MAGRFEWKASEASAPQSRLHCPFEAKRGTILFHVHGCGSRSFRRSNSRVSALTLPAGSPTVAANRKTCLAFERRSILHKRDPDTAADGGFMRSVSRTLITFAWMAILPSALYAQASITGVVKDPSGAVLPGVTVEAASPALIEKVRSVVSDGTGQYRIQDLRPGAY